MVDYTNTTLLLRPDDNFIDLIISFNVELSDHRPNLHKMAQAVGLKNYDEVLSIKVSSILMDQRLRKSFVSKKTNNVDTEQAVQSCFLGVGVHYTTLIYFLFVTNPSWFLLYFGFILMKPMFAIHSSCISLSDKEKHIVVTSVHNERFLLVRLLSNFEVLL